jgi:hypothetical protein
VDCRIRCSRFRLFLIAVMLPAVGCGGSDATGPAGTGLSLSLTGLRKLNADTEGSYEAWVVEANGSLISAGKFSDGGGTVRFALPVPSPSGVVITVEPPGDTDPGPSSQRLLTGSFKGASASLNVDGAVTQGTLALREQPGQFTMFSPSDNLVNGYPSFEESGVWLFNMAPKDTPQNDGWVRLTQIRDGWIYEGWMVRDYGTSSAIWLSYGKFRPDQSGAVNSRDDTGWGPFSGVLDFQTAGEEEYPGDDWISNPLQLPFPSALTLPLNLRETTTSGQSRWTHVITIEPSWNKGEALTTERPFLIVPYRDPFGTGAPGDPRTITYHSDGVPRGTASVQ